MNKAQQQVALAIIKRLVGYLCATVPEQGDYCRCGAYVGAGEKHKSSCDYVRAMRFLKKWEDQ